MTCDTDQFYNEEVIGRQLMNFPAISPNGRCLLQGFREDEVSRTATNFHKILEKYMNAEDDQMMPAIPCSMY